MNPSSPEQRHRFSPHGGGVWWPNGWVEDLRRTRRGTLGLAVFFGICLLGALMLSSDGRAVSLTGALLIGVILFGSSVQTRAQYRSAKAVRQRADPGLPTPGSFFRTSVWSTVALNLVFLTLAVFLLASPWLATLTAGDSGYFNAVFQRIAPWLPYMSPLLLPFLLSFFIRGMKPTGVMLVPEGIRHRSMFGACSYDWKGIAKIDGDSDPFVIRLEASAEDPSIPGSKENWLNRVLRDRMRNIPAASLAINPAVALRAIEFYHQNPERRNELGTQEGPRRIRAANFNP